ncbi:uncharacterized protein LOC131597117 [Vicia villosa]|uniref:uncharacterized protein LOC131597117 n=1 Tax=Vicia villosa TaxID=3911 RepID=UPI00273BF790|nr:uncharacterized protein LOC131597117 [Vicia villosa]
MSNSWMIAGDFNDIASVTEKKGGASMSNRKCNIFIDCITNFNLMDIGTTGPKFTWRGSIYHSGQRIYEKLDRALCNEDCRMKFPDAHVKVLTRVNFSNHHPLLVMLDSQHNYGGQRQFMFESDWLLNGTYHDMIRVLWKEDICLEENLSKVRNDIKD